MHGVNMWLGYFVLKIISFPLGDVWPEEHGLVSPLVWFLCQKWQVFIAHIYGMLAVDVWTALV